MKYRLPLLLLLAFFMPLSVQATDLFIKKKPAVTDEAQTTVPELENKPKVEPAPQAPPPVTVQDFANKYYKSCLGQNHPILKDKNLQLLCSCTAAKIPGTMTIPQIKAMNTDTPEGLYQRNRMMMFVYAPCLEYPTRALVVDQCMSSPEVQKVMKHGPTVCSCLGDGMAKFMKEHGPKAIQNAIARNQSDLDPLGSLMQSESFDEESKAVMHDCVALYELGQARQ